MIAAIIKSKNAAAIAEIGKVSLGKNILVTKLLLLTTEREPKFTEVVKKVHGNNALYAKIG